MSKLPGVNPEYIVGRWRIEFHSPTSLTVFDLRSDDHSTFTIGDNYAVSDPTSIPKKLRHVIENLAARVQSYWK